MKTLAWFILATALLAGPVLAADEACLGEGSCRQVGTVTVSAGGRLKQVDVNQVIPYVADGNVLLFSGEVMVFRLEAADGRLQPRFVAAGAEAAGRKLGPAEMRVTLGAGDNGTLMKIESGHDRWLDYQAIMMTPGGRPARTSVCTVMAGKLGFEQWGDPIVYLALANFTAVPDGQAVCR